MKSKLSAAYEWFLYYPYIIFFTLFSATEVEETPQSIGNNAEDVRIFGMTAVAQAKFCKKIKIRIYIKAGRKQDSMWFVRFIPDEDYFAYKLGSTEPAQIDGLIKLRMV